MTLKEYWSFTWAEMGYYDLPATVNKVLQETSSPKLTLIAHS